MKSFREQRWLIIVYGVLFITIGLLELILSIVDLGTAVKVLSYSVAASLFIVGLLHIIVSLVVDTKTFFKAALILGCVAIAVGVVLCVYPWILQNFLIIFVAVLALALGVVALIKGIIAIVYRYKGGWIFLYFLAAVLLITLGVLALVFEKKADLAVIIYASTGAFIFLLGAFLLITGIKLVSKTRE